MAFLLRSASRLSRNALLSCHGNRTWRQTQFLISTMKKKDDIKSPPIHTEDEELTPEEQFPADPKHPKNWISFGFSETDPELDRWCKNMFMFGSITVCLLGTMFILAYMPDFKLQNWCQREAYLELERRERLGLPLIDPNLIPPDKMVLPTEEELGDMEVII